MTMKTRFSAIFPSDVVGEGGITIDKEGATTTIGFDMDSTELAAELQQAVDAAGAASDSAAAAADAAAAASPFVFNVSEYGAVSDGTTDDLSAVNDAISAAAVVGGTVAFPPATTLVSSRINVFVDNVSFRGLVPGGACRIKIPNTYTNGVVCFHGSGFSCSDLTIDQNNATGSTGAALLVESSSYFTINRVRIAGMYNGGVTIESCTDWVVDDCDVTMDTPTGTFNNYGIGAFSSLTTNLRGRISNNRCNGAGVFSQAEQLEILYNNVRGTKYGAAINTSNRNKNIIIGNILSNGRSGALDVNDTPCSGMEILGSYHVIADNQIFDFDGAGIVSFADDSLIQGNLIWDVAKLGVTARTENQVGISAANAGTATQGETGSRNLIQGNKVFQTGGLTDILYGYSEFNVSGSGVLNNRVINNQLVGATADTNIAAATTHYVNAESTAPNTQTGSTYTVVATDTSIIADRAGTVTLTLPAAATFVGRRLVVKTVQAQTVVSASSNVVPLIGGSAGTAILAGTAGKWAELKSDGTSWVIMAAN